MRTLKQTHKVELAVVEHTGKGFQVVKHRWKVERTFVWVLNDRRHNRDDEGLTTNNEALIHISMIWLLLDIIRNNRIVKFTLRYCIATWL